MLGSKKTQLVLSLAVLVCGLIPIGHYWYTVGRVPSLTPPEAINVLAAVDSNTILVDVRSQLKFNELHPQGAENWPYNEIMALSSSSPIPVGIIDKTVLLICDSGIRSASAAQRLRQEFGLDAFNVAGGMESWIASADSTGALFENALGEQRPAPVKESPLYEQVALVAAIFVVKPLYMLGALALIYALWRTRSSDLAALRWGFIFFLAGETSCAINIIFFSHTDYLLEYLHSYGMMVGFGFIIYAILEALDMRFLHWSAPDDPCAMRSLCHHCSKEEAPYCKGERLFVFLILALVLLSFIPLNVSTEAISYNTTIFNFFHNYSHSVVFQIFETCYSPVYAIGLLVASLSTLILVRRNRIKLSRVLFAAGVGAIVFSFLRTILVNIFHDNLVWFNFWEETTELMFVIGVGLVLYIFRQELIELRVIPELTNANSK